MPQILTVAADLGIVTEAEVFIPEALYVYWPPGTNAHFWYRRGGDNVITTIDTQMAVGTVPGRAIAHSAALNLYNWPRRLDYVFRSGPWLFHIDILNGSTRQLITRDGNGEPLQTDFQGLPLAHPNGSYYWTESTFESNVRYFVRWSPTTQTHPSLLRQFDVGDGNGEQSGAQVFYRTYACIPGGDRTVAFTVDYLTGEVGTVGRSIFARHNRFSASIPAFSDASADVWAGTESGGAYGYYGYGSARKLLTSFVASGQHRVGTTGLSRGDADAEIDTVAIPHSAMHFNAARTIITVYPYRGAGTAIDPYALKQFDPAQLSSAEINSNPNKATALVSPLVSGDFDTSPHQVWPWGPTQ